MRVAYYSGYSSWWGAYGPDVLEALDAGQVGGGETCMLCTAFDLARRGHDVSVYYGGAPAEYRGARFAPAHKFFREVDDYDVAVAWGDVVPLAAVDRTKTKAVLAQQLNDMLGGITAYRHADAIVCPSDYHRRFMRTLGWTRAAYVCHNGCDLEAYEGAPALATRAPVVGAWSSPDRGLHHLLAVWPLVLRRVPAARLRVYYEIDRLLAMSPFAPNEVGFRLRYLKQLKDAAPASTAFVGAVSRRRMIEAQIETRVMCYPCDTVGMTEGFGQAVVEALAAGCFTVIGACDALPSLFGGGAHVVGRDELWDQRYEDLVDLIVQGLTIAEDPKADGARGIAARYTWENSGREMEEALCSTLA